MCRIIINITAMALSLLVIRADIIKNEVVLVKDGAWTWFNDPRALLVNSNLFFSYVRNSDGKTMLSMYHLGAGKTVELWGSSFSQKDDHNVASLLLRSDGSMLATYARHHTDDYFAYRFSSGDPSVVNNWSEEKLVSSLGDRLTYANLVRLSGEGNKIYNFTRLRNFNPTIFISTNNGFNWSGPFWFIKTGTNGRVRPYFKVCSDNISRIDIVYTDGHPRDVENSLYHLYYVNGAFYKSDGNLVKHFSMLPIEHDSGERGTAIYRFSHEQKEQDPNDCIPSGRAWCWDLAYAKDGKPVCVFSVQLDNVTGPRNGIDDRIHYYYAFWTGSNWVKMLIAHAGRPLYPAEDDYAGGICLNPGDPTEVILSTNAKDPFNIRHLRDVPLNENERYQLWRGVFDPKKLVFSWTQLTFSTNEDNIRPYIPASYGKWMAIIWMRGIYKKYTEFNTQIVGSFRLSGQELKP